MQKIQAKKKYNEMSDDEKRKYWNELSKKYLQQPFYKIPSDKATVMTECLSILDKTDMDTGARVDVLYDL